MTSLKCIGKRKFYFTSTFCKTWFSISKWWEQIWAHLKGNFPIALAFVITHIVFQSPFISGLSKINEFELANVYSPYSFVAPFPFFSPHFICDTQNAYFRQPFLLFKVTRTTEYSNNLSRFWAISCCLYTYMYIYLKETKTARFL